MATSSKNNVSLVIEAGVTGEAEIRKFADEVRRLAKEGSDAAPEFQALAAELDGFAEQGGAIAAVRALADQFTELTAEQTRAKVAAESVGVSLAEQKAKADALRASQQTLKDEISAARLEVLKAENSVREYSKQFDAAGKKTAEYRSKSEELQATLSLTRQQLLQKRLELEKLTPAVSQAVAAESRLASQFDALSASAARSAGALKQRATALEQAEAAARAVGVNTDDLVASENALLASTQRVAAETSRLAQQRREAASAAAALADLDRQNEQALQRQQQRLFAIVEAYEAEQAALVQAKAAADAKRRADFDAIEALAAKEARTKLAAEAAAREAAASREAAAETRRLAAEAEQAEAEFNRLQASLREAAEAADRLSRAEGAAAMRALERAAAQADSEFRELTASLRGAESAAEEFAAATERAAAAGQDDVAATQARVRAAQQLVATEQALTRAQSELAASRNAGRAALLQEAQALLASARAADESRAATERLVRQAQSAADILTNAFGQTGVRSLQAIEAEILQVERSLSLLERKARAGAIGADDLARASGSAAVRLATLKREIETIPALPGTFERLNSQVNDLIGRFGSLTAAFATVGIAVRPFLDAALALDQIRRVLTTVTGSAEQAQRQIEFLRNAAQQSGQAFNEIGASYSKFAASALQSGVSLKDTQAVFASVALAAGNLGLSSDQAKRALEALSQIASKGVVSMEELRQQLGDALPGVLPLLAKELGLTQAELNKVVESGQLLASEAIPAIGRALTQLAPTGGSGVSGLIAEFNRLKNVVFEAGTTFTDGPFGFAIGVALKSIALLVGSLAIGVATLSEAFRVAGVTIYETLLLVANRDLPAFKKAIADATSESADRLAGLSRRFAGTGDAAQGATAGVGALGNSFARLALEQQKAVDAADINARSLETLAQAQQKALQGTISLVQQSGDQQRALDLAAESQRSYADSLEAQAVADQQAADARRAFRDALIEEALRRGQTLDSVKAGVEALNNEIRTKDASAAKSREQADALRGVAVAAEIQAEAFRDNAGRYEEFADLVEGATRALDGVRRAFLRGKATTDDVRKAEEALAVAKARLNDAIDDQVARSERLVEGLKVEADFTKALLELDIARLKVKQQEALDRGAETIARQLGIQIAELELQVTKTGAAAKRAEANELIRSLTLRKEELRLAGQLTPAVEADLNVRIRRAQIQTLEADTTEVSTEAEEKHLQAVRNGTAEVDRNTTSTTSSTEVLQSNTKARRENADATGKQSDAQKRYNDLLLNDPTRLVSGGPGVGISSSGLTGVRDPGSSAGPGNQGKPASAGTMSAGGTKYDEQGFADFTTGFQVPVPEGYYYTMDPYAPGAIRAGTAPNGFAYPGYFAPILGGPGAAPPAPAPAPEQGASSGRRGPTVTLNLNVGGRVFPVASDEATANALLAQIERERLASGG